MTKKVFNRNALVAAAAIAEKRGYNRQIPREVLAALQPDRLYPIEFSMLHEHAAGFRVDAHVRCLVASPFGVFAVDCDADLFDALPEVAA